MDGSMEKFNGWLLGGVSNRSVIHASNRISLIKAEKRTTTLRTSERWTLNGKVNGWLSEGVSNRSVIPSYM